MAMGRQSLLERTVKERVGQTLVGIVGAAVDRVTPTAVAFSLRESHYPLS